MSPKSDRERVQDLIETQDPDQFKRMLARLPESLAELEAKRVAELVVPLLTDRPRYPTLFAQHVRPVPVSVQHAVMAQLRDKKDAASVILSRLVKNEDLADSWRRSLDVLVALDGSWTSTKRKAALRSLAGRSDVVAALQAGIASTSCAWPEVIAVLLADGSQVSTDTLRPIFERHDDLELLNTLKHFAVQGTPAFELFQEMAVRRQQAQQCNPVVVFVNEQLEIHVGEIDVRALWGSTQKTKHGASRYHGMLWLNSTTREPWTCWCTRSELRTERGDPLPPLNIEPCKDLATFPTWIRHVARELGVTWEWDWMVASLRPADRERFKNWVQLGYVTAK